MRNGLSSTLFRALVSPQVCSALSVQLHVAAAVLKQLRVVATAVLAQLRVVVAAVLAQLRVVVAAVLAQLRVVVAVLSAQLRVVAAVLVQLHAVAVLSAQLHVVSALLVRHVATALLVRPRASAVFLECSPFAALWYAALSSSACSLRGSCSHVLAVSLRRLGSYVRLSRQRLFAWCYVLAQSYVLEPWCGQRQRWSQLPSRL